VCVYVYVCRGKRQGREREEEAKPSKGQAKQGD